MSYTQSHNGRLFALIYASLGSPVCDSFQAGKSFGAPSGGDIFTGTQNQLRQQFCWKF